MEIRWWWVLVTFGSVVLAFPNFCTNFVENPADMTTSEAEFSNILQKGRQRSFSHDDISSIDPRPSWLDKNSLRRGQEFAKDYYFGISMSEMISLYLLFADKHGRKPLIYTNNSNTVYTAFKRYLSTTERVKSWYETDILDQNSLGYRNLKAVYFLHRTVGKKVNSLDDQELEEKTNMEQLISPRHIKDRLHNVLKRDVMLMDVVPCTSGHGTLISQYDMAMTQFGFMGLVALYPERFGIYGSAKNGIIDFIHLWGYIGHMLGIEDTFNICQGEDLDDIKMKLQVVLKYHFKPVLTTIDSEWEHMSRVMTEGVNVYTNAVMFETSLMYLWKTLDIPSDNFYSKLTFTQRLVNWLLNFMFTYVVPYRWPRNLLTSGVRHNIERVSKELNTNGNKYRRLLNAV